jgi:hypothetical protein
VKEHLIDFLLLDKAEALVALADLLPTTMGVITD